MASEQMLWYIFTNLAFYSDGIGMPSILFAEHMRPMSDMINKLS